MPGIVSGAAWGREARIIQAGFVRFVSRPPAIGEVGQDRAHKPPRFMADEIRIRELLETVLESGRTPEEVCTDCPDLLPVIRMRMRQIRRVERALEGLFPSRAPREARVLRAADQHGLPQTG